jgi:protoheme IX farnesyltransferase
MLPSYMGMSGAFYLIGALLLGFTYFFAGVKAKLEPTRARARGILLASVVYLPLLFGLMMLDRSRL